jgi:hypothetical protein
MKLVASHAQEETRVPKLGAVRIERRKGDCDRFNGIPFPSAVPGWTGFYRLAGDPVEYRMDGLVAQTQNHAYSLLLCLLRDRGIDIRKA